MGTQTKLVANGLTLYESFTAGTAKNFRGALGIDYTRVKRTGAVFTTIRGSKDCSLDLSETEE